MIRELLTARQARRDAAHGINSVEERLLARHGTSKAIDGTTNLEDRNALATLQRTDIDDHREELQRIEDEQAHHESATSLTLKLGGCFAAEVLGCMLLFCDLGLSGIERIGLALLFAAFIFFLTAQASRSMEATHSRFFMLTIAAYAAVVLSVTILRTINASTEDGSRLEEISVGVIMAATSLGAAWLAESIIRKRRPAVMLANQRRNVLRRLHAAQRDHDRADRYLRRRDREARAATDAITRDRATYNAVHHLTKGEKQ